MAVEVVSPLLPLLVLCSGAVLDPLSTGTPPMILLLDLLALLSAKISLSRCFCSSVVETSIMSTSSFSVSLVLSGTRLEGR